MKKLALVFLMAIFCTIVNLHLFTIWLACVLYKNG
jgi:hypothetical protein